MHSPTPFNHLAILATLIALCTTGPACAQQPDHLPAPKFDKAFWQHWSDGHAELAAYDLTFTRYGQPRQGTAVAIFVTETFSDSRRVKADPGKHPDSDQYPVIKLNLVQDFPTGIYDYNMMTSAFVTLTPHHNRPPGSPTKVSFSSQEWCGHVYHQVLFHDTSLEHQSHSYFDGEADQQAKLPYPTQGVTEDTLLLWARGFAAPALRPGQSIKTKLLTSLTTARLNHTDIRWHNATLTRDPETHTVTVPAGEFTARTLTAQIDGGPTWTFHVENAPPNRVLKWSNTQGQSAQLIASDRLEYWRMNAEQYESALTKLGLSPRPKRTP